MLSPDTSRQPFWRLSAKGAAELFETDPQWGITDDEARQRLSVFGKNILEQPKTSPALRILINQFRSPLILVLIFAAIVTIVIGHYRDAFFILTAIVINAILGFYQEHKAEQALAELTTYLRLRARVIRGGAERDIDADLLVPGDILRLSQGDRVPADGRFVFVNDLQVDEAILTGESLPVTKDTEPSDAGASLGDQRSSAFAGTLITQGVATVIVCRTGEDTEIGKIALLVGASERETTPLQKAIQRFSIQSSIVLAVLTVIVFFIGIAAGHSTLDMFLISIAIAVSAIPEGLPVAMTVILAVGVERMARRNGVVRKLVAAEALGSTTLILTDKTGTLTMAKMALARVVPAGDLDEQTLISRALLNINVLIENPNEAPDTWRMSGRPLETALAHAAAMRGILFTKLADLGEVLQTLPFNAVNKFSATLLREPDKTHRLLFFGAPDILVGHSALSGKAKEEMLAQIHSLASAGERVLGVASKLIQPTGDFSFEHPASSAHLSFDGLLTFRDPVRPSIKDTIRRLEYAGITTAIVTGDHRGTAEAVAKEAGIEVPVGGVIEAQELSEMSDAELAERLPSLRVFARVTPTDKVRIAKAFQKAGEIVAMTGDGVNDAPSIKQADVGIAMGSGTEVSRSVADLVLLDDNFETIAAAVDEGRQIVNNIRKVLVYLLSSITNELLLIGGALIIGIPLPLSALQLLWVNFFSDSFPAIAFAFEKGIDGLSSRARGGSVRLFDPVMRFLIIGVGMATSVLLFVLYWALLRSGYDPEIVRTFIFACFGTYTLFLPFSVRSLEKSIFEYSLFSNRYLVAGVGVGAILMALAVYAPFLQSLLGTVALPSAWLIGVLAIGFINITAVEAGKRIFRSEASARRLRKAL
jgi:P-type Ca2+ transporter type 2C